MKHLVKVSLIFGVAFLIACGGGNQPQEELTENPTAAVSAENLIMADYKIDGMVCAMGCAKTIQDEIGELDGVTTSKVDFESGKAHFEFDGSKVSENDLVAKIGSIADGQYQASPWKNEQSLEENTTEMEATKESSEEVTDHVDVSFSAIEIPNLFTYLIKNL